ncbi:hypothetical protein [Arcobacter sp.]
MNFYKIIEENLEREIGIFRTSSSKTLLIIDFITSDIEGNKSSIEYFENSSKVFNYSILKRSILETLHLVLPYGLGYYKYVSKSFNSNVALKAFGGITKFFGDLEVHTSHIKPYTFSPLVDVKLMRLKNEDYSEFENIFNRIYDLNIQKDNQYSRILKQSIDYHILAKTFLNNEQTFAILMIAIEAMFKQYQNESLQKYIKEIGKLLSNNIKDRGRMEKSFHNFIPLRNDIVHGDEYSLEELSKNLLELYKYVRQCILEILEINEKISLNNYYIDLFDEIEKRWKKKINLTKKQ